MTETTRDARTARLARLVPAAFAVFELRYLVQHGGRELAALGTAAATGALALPVLMLAAVALGLVLRESSRGLARRFGRVTWSLRLLGTWLACAAALAVCVGVVELALPALGHPLAAAHWTATAPALLGAGLMLAASLHGVRWLTGRVVSLRWLRVVRRRALRLLTPAAQRRPLAAPLRVGWSDRGPPALPVPAAI